MSRRDDFVTLIQTLALSARPNVPTMLDAMTLAMALPEEAIPANLRESAVAFWDHVVFRKAEPDWLATHREGKVAREQAERERVTISLNRDGDCDAWWLQAEACASGIPRSCLEIVTGRVESLRVPRRDAELFRDWGRSVPGWEESSPPFHFRDAAGREV